jgi:cytochrome b6-f complex iron-sulfur subunit
MAEITKPAPVSKPASQEISRRHFLSWVRAGWIAFTAAVAAGSISTFRFLFPNVLFEPPLVFKAGFPTEYSDGVVDERWKEKFRVWVVREGNVMYALRAVCTHLGCIPNWFSNDEKFKCPCHGSGFYRTGINFEGPAPRPLERVRISRADDGQILIDKTQIFQQEKGQWSNPESYLVI